MLTSTSARLSQFLPGSKTSVEHYLELPRFVKSRGAPGTEQACQCLRLSSLEGACGSAGTLYLDVGALLMLDIRRTVCDEE